MYPFTTLITDNFVSAKNRNKHEDGELDDDGDPETYLSFLQCLENALLEKNILF